MVLLVMQIQFWLSAHLMFVTFDILFVTFDILFVKGPNYLDSDNSISCSPVLCSFCVHCEYSCAWQVSESEEPG